MPLFGVLLLGCGGVVAVDRFVILARLRAAGALGPEITGIIGVFLLFFYGILVNGAQDEQGDAQPRRHGEQHQQRDGWDAGKDMAAAFWLHGSRTSYNKRTVFHFIIAEYGSFVKG